MKMMTKMNNDADDMLVMVTIQMMGLRKMMMVLMMNDSKK